MQEYVVGFIFDSESDKLLLIRKNRPDWQKGLLNGIGGKIEDGESPLEAMQRECREECGLRVSNWNELCIITDEESFRVYFFSAVTQTKGVFQGTDEELVFVDKRAIDYSRCIDNLSFLIPMAMNPLHSSYTIVEKRKNMEKVEKKESKDLTIEESSPRIVKRFEINENEEIKLDKIVKAIAFLYDGDAGEFKYIFSSNGVNEVVEIHSETLDKNFDITDYENK